MPNKIRYCCHHPGCPVLAQTGKYCDKHKSPKPDWRAYDKTRASSTERGYDSKWRKLRLWHLNKYPLCIRCGRPATMVDHIIPISKGGDQLPSEAGLQSMCGSCHSRKTLTEDRLGGNNKRKGRVI